MDCATGTAFTLPALPTAMTLRLRQRRQICLYQSPGTLTLGTQVGWAACSPPRPRQTEKKGCKQPNLRPWARVNARGNRLGGCPAVSEASLTTKTRRSRRDPRREYQHPRRNLHLREILRALGVFVVYISCLLPPRRHLHLREILRALRAFVVYISCLLPLVGSWRQWSESAAW